MGIQNRLKAGLEQFPGADGVFCAALICVEHRFGLFSTFALRRRPQINQSPLKLKKLADMNSVVRIFLIFLCALISERCLAESYPSKPIRIVTAGVGSSADFAARLIGQGLLDNFGHAVVVDNRGSGVVPGELVAKSAPDGYTLLLMGTSFWLAPFLHENTPYDPVTDFLPITLAAQAPNILVVHGLLPVKTVRDLIALAKARPGQLNYYSGGTGATNHLAAELFKAMAKVDIVRVPYKNSSQGLTDLISGNVQMTITAPAAAMPYVRTGRLRALAVASATRSKLVPNLPTIAETLPGYEAVTFNAMFAPARTPDAIIKQLNEEIVQVLTRSDIKDKFYSTGVEVVASSASKLSMVMTAEMNRMGKVIHDVGIKEE